jgi:myb proto-oncogene protein
MLLLIVLPGSDLKLEPVDHAWTPEKEKQTSPPVDYTRPDALLGSDWLEPITGFKDQSIMTDAIASLLGEDLANDYKHMSSGTSTSNQGWGLGSCPWNNMPAVCQMSDLP